MLGGHLSFPCVGVFPHMHLGQAAASYDLRCAACNSLVNGLLMAEPVGAAVQLHGVGSVALSYADSLCAVAPLAVCW